MFCGREEVFDIGPKLFPIALMKTYNSILGLQLI